MTKALPLFFAALLAGTASPVKAPKASVTVTITAATMGDDCGPKVDTAPAPTPKANDATPTPAPAPAESSEAAPQHGDSPDSGAASMLPPRCQQSSMQLSVVSPAGSDKAELRVKKVELFDENGTLIGQLTPKSPSIWKSDAYKPWDQRIKAGESIAVSYALSKPSWGGVLDRYSKTYKLKVVLTTGGSDQSLEHDVTLYTETSLPPGVVT